MKNKHINHYKFSHTFLQINGYTKKKGIKVSKLFHLIGKRSNYILSFFSYMVIAIPLPIPPGFSTVLALIPIFITIQNLYNREKVIWVPKIISNLRISKNFIRKFNSISQKYFVLIDKFTKQRLHFITSKYMYKINDIALLIFAVMSAIPIPFEYMVPAIAGMLLSAGLVMKDGLLVIISWIVGIIGISIIAGTIEAVLKIKTIIPILLQ